MSFFGGGGGSIFGDTISLDYADKSETIVTTDHLAPIVKAKWKIDLNDLSIGSGDSLTLFLVFMFLYGKANTAGATDQSHFRFDTSFDDITYTEYDTLSANPFSPPSLLSDIATTNSKNIDNTHTTIYFRLILFNEIVTETYTWSDLEWQVLLFPSHKFNITRLV